MTKEEITPTIRRIQLSNILTNLVTVILFIGYSGFNRFDVSFPKYVFVSLFLINSIACLVLLYNNNRQTIRTGIHNGWLIIRIIANFGLFVLSIFS